MDSAGWVRWAHVLSSKPTTPSWPQRAPMRDGVWSRESRHGRPGHDDPYLLTAGTPGFGFRTGEAPPPWLPGITLPGRVLAETGLPAPLVTPQQAALFTVDAL